MARDRDNPPVELISLKLELIDRLDGYEIKPKDLIPYEKELRALLNFSSGERARRFNRLVGKVRSKYRDRRA